MGSRRSNHRNDREADRAQPNTARYATRHLARQEWRPARRDPDAIDATQCLHATAFALFCLLVIAWALDL